ncbi:hypothetical protein ACGYLO_12475 [Sulfitobacter sp. 1A13353]|uniref:hypothetical protein n=1 Tax=Sulfitobacter sp. 1A13353 TaxID=3368568 RepID=UPI003746AB9F
MHYDLSEMSQTQAAAFMKRRMAHANLGIIQEAMADAGVKNIRVIGRTSDEVLKIDRDCEWQYTRDPEEVGNPEVKLLDWSLGNHLYGMEPRPLRDAVRACAFDIMNTLAPCWNEAENALLDLNISDKDAKLVGHIDTQGLERIQVNAKLEAYDPVAALGEPVLHCHEGSWYEIKDKHEAKAATRLGQNGVEVHYGYYTSTNKDGERPDQAEEISWLTFVEHDGAESRAEVTMAAQKNATYDAEKWPHSSHVTGYQNADAYHFFEADIYAVSEFLDLHVEPNHMCRALPEPEAEDNLEP